MATCVMMRRRMSSMSTGARPVFTMWPPSIDDDAALALRRGGDGADDGAEVARDEDVGQRVEKGAEGAVVAGRMREVARADLVGADRDGHGAHVGEIRFAERSSVSPYGVGAVVVAGAGRYDVR